MMKDGKHIYSSIATDRIFFKWIVNCALTPELPHMSGQASSPVRSIHAFLFPSRYSEGETPSALLKSLLK